MSECSSWYGAVIVILITIICVLVVHLIRREKPKPATVEYTLRDLQMYETKKRLDAGYIASDSDTASNESTNETNLMMEVQN